MTPVSMLQHSDLLIDSSLDQSSSSTSCPQPTLADKSPHWKQASLVFRDALCSQTNIKTFSNSRLICLFTHISVTIVTVWDTQGTGGPCCSRGLRGFWGSFDMWSTAKTKRINWKCLEFKHRLCSLWKKRNYKAFTQTACEIYRGQVFDSQSAALC